MGENSFTLVTGATSAIGQAIATRLASSRRLLLHGRDSAKLNELKSKCCNPENHEIWAQDCRQLAEVASSLERLLAGNTWQVNAFIYVAGVVVRVPVRHLTLEQLQESLAVNFMAAQQVLSVLTKKRINGESLTNIVAISSVAGQFGVRGHAAYCAGKAALDGWIRAIAVELAPRIRANSLLLGPVSTPATAEVLSSGETSARISLRSPMGLGKPEDAASAVEWLLSKGSAWMTGQQIVMDGGLTTNVTL